MKLRLKKSLKVRNDLMKREYESSFQWYMRVFKSWRRSKSPSAIKRGTRTMYTWVANQTKKQTEEDLKKLVQTTVDEFESKTGVEVDDNFVARVVAMVIAGKLYKTKWTLAKAVKGISAKMDAVIDAIIENGKKQGKTDAEIAEDILAVINPNDSQYQHVIQTDDGNVYVPKIGTATSTLMRTTLEHGYQETVKELAEVLADHTEKKVMIRWISALAHNTCEVCESRHNELYEPSELPLEHPNGQCKFCIEYHD